MPRNRTTIVHLCVDCQTPVPYRAKRCSECIRLHKNAMMRERREIRRLNAPPRERYCRNCGVDVTHLYHNVFYCKSCASLRLKEFQLQYQREYARSEKMRAYYREYNQRPEWKERERQRSKIRRSTELGQQISSAMSHKRKRLKATQLGNVSLNIRDKLRQAQGNKCANCKEKLKDKNIHLDHIMPLSLGGLHDDGNLQVLCASCNLRKANKHPLDFARHEGRLL